MFFFSFSLFIKSIIIIIIVSHVIRNIDFCSIVRFFGSIFVNISIPISSIDVIEYINIVDSPISACFMYFLKFSSVSFLCFIRKNNDVDIANILYVIFDISCSICGSVLRFTLYRLKYVFLNSISSMYVDIAAIIIINFLFVSFIFSIIFSPIINYIIILFVFL